MYSLCRSVLTLLRKKEKDIQHGSVYKVLNEHLLMGNEERV